MVKYRYRKKGSMYREIGRIEGQVIMRYKGAAPFLVTEKELAIDFFDTMPNEPPVILERKKAVQKKLPAKKLLRVIAAVIDEEYCGFGIDKNLKLARRVVKAIKKEESEL